jgi:hypothetical protein
MDLEAAAGGSVKIDNGGAFTDYSVTESASVRERKMATQEIHYRYCLSNRYYGLGFFRIL